MGVMAGRQAKRVPNDNETGLLPGRPQSPFPEPEIVNVRRRQGRSVETRGKILEAATEEFASGGFEGATTRSIADRAQVRHGLVIYHFGTKLGVWQAVMERGFSDFHTQFTETVSKLSAEGVDNVTMLRTLNRIFVRFSAERPELNWMMSHEAGHSSPRLEWLLDTIIGQDASFGIELIRQAQKTGHFVAGDPAHLHFVMLGAVSRIFMHASEVEPHFKLSPFSKEFVEQHVSLIESLFFREPAGQGA